MAAGVGRSSSVCLSAAARAASWGMRMDGALVAIARSRFEKCSRLVLERVVRGLCLMVSFLFFSFLLRFSDMFMNYARGSK